MKKLTMIAALLAIMLTASASLVLAQQTPPADAPAEEAPADSSGAAEGPTVGCQVLFNDPAATCPVDENGSITLPDGSTAPVVVEPDGTAYIIEESGNATVIGQGASFIADEDPAGGGSTGGGGTGGIQYDNAQGEPQGASQGAPPQETPSEEAPPEETPQEEAPPQSTPTPIGG